MTSKAEAEKPGLNTDLHIAARAQTGRPHNDSGQRAAGCGEWAGGDRARDFRHAGASAARAPAATHAKPPARPGRERIERPASGTPLATTSTCRSACRAARRLLSCPGELAIPSAQPQEINGSRRLRSACVAPHRYRPWQCRPGAACGRWNALGAKRKTPFIRFYVVISECGFHRRWGRCRSRFCTRRVCC
jgi:hypothetical protein